MQAQGIASQQVTFSEKERVYLDNDNFFLNEDTPNEATLEINKHSLKQLLLAFLREAIFSYHYQNNNLVFDFPSSNYFLYVNNVKLFSLLRFTSFDSLVLISKENCSSEFITDPLKLLEILKIELNNTLNLDQWVKVYNEVANHLQNAALSSQEKTKLKKAFFLEKDKKKHCNTLSHIFDLYKNVKNSSLRFEQMAFNGHPYHPCAKTKLGFSVEDVINYSPEFCPKVSIFLSAVHKNYLHVERSKENLDFTDWFAKHYSNAFENWLVELNRLSLNANDYLPFPVHPWQAAHIIPNLFADYIKEKIIILLENITISMSPTLSFRTLAPIEYLQAPYFKLSVAVQATSVVRTITNASTENTPKITSILEKILKKENNFSGKLFILPEYFGLHLKNINEEKAKNFTAIFRENINNYLQANEMAIVVATLFEKIPSNNKVFFVELLQLAGCLNYTSALNYFYNYVEVILGGYLDLYLIYGIALEGHQQNTLAIFQNASIKRVMARDFAGIRIHGTTLKGCGFKYKVYSGSPTLTENKSTVRNQLLYTVYQIHLGELILLLAELFSCEETPFWAIVKSITCQRFEQLKGKLKKSVWETEYDAILKKNWSLKALLRMRLEKNHQPHNFFSSISNPLPT